MYLRKMNKLDIILEEADKIALEHLEQLARDVLTSKDKSHYFLMAMGTYFFMDKNREIIYDLPNQNKLDDFISDYDRLLKLTGNPMTFTAKGEIITDW